ncbi:MAG TPA: cell envelope integrity protein TolA [Usitatibacter sp.]|nr:cell envelope integrity protein TolA [Usitatibacter sp.]
MSSRQAPPRANLERPPQPGRVRSVILAIVVHAVFFAFIVFGVNWQSREAAPYQAELWDKLPPAQPKQAPVKPEPPKPQPQPPKPEPQPPKPAPEPPKPPAEVAKPPPKPDPEIALRAEREKKEQERKAKAEKLERDKREKEKAEHKQKKEDAQKKREEDARKVEEQQAFEAAQQQREAAASRLKAEEDEFTRKIQAKIRSKANVPDTVVGHPTIQVSIRILPGGEVLDVTVVKPSGNPAYDAAIERAIRSASPLPVPEPSSELFARFRNPKLNITHDR